MRFLLVTAFFAGSFLFADAPSATGLQIAGTGDIVGQMDVAPASQATNRLLVREAEVVLFAPVDPLFDAQLSLAAHQEATGAFFEIHEVFIGSSKLIPRSRFRVGQFFLAIGRLNQFHRHDWPFTTAPKVHREFFRSQEAAIDSGLEYSYLVPTPFFLDITLGLTNGWVFGHAHNPGFKPLTPTHYAKATTYFDLPWEGGIQTGLNYLARTDSAGEKVNLLGIDTTAKWKEASRLVFLWQSEIWLRFTRPARAAKAEQTLGFYLYPQYGWDEWLSIGLRLDGYHVLNLGASNFEWALVPTLTYKASEFSTLRLSYQNVSGQVAGATTVAQRLLELQAIFILGAHPAHDF